MKHDHGGDSYKKNSITLGGAVAMGTGVMIGAGIFALTGQIAELAGPLFPIAFIIGAIVTGFSSYSYIKMSNAWPSAGGIGMILQKCYGPGGIAAGGALLMALSMVIAESLVAKTFATYLLRPFSIDGGPLVPVLAVGVILFAYLVNIGFAAASQSTGNFGATGFVASVALAILAFKGFTTITNSGAEITDPNRNVGRAIILSIALCVVVYLLVAFGVGSSLTIDEIIAAKDYSLAEAAKPALGQVGFLLTVLLAVVATASAVLASVFAVSRMLAMLTNMKMIPHSHFGMSGPIQRHRLVYTVIIASFLAVFFDLSRIASLGAFFYLTMDMLVHWGVWRYRRAEIGASGVVILAALGFDAIVLVAFTAMKLQSDPAIVAYAALTIAGVFLFERAYLSRWLAPQDEPAHS